MKSKSQKPRFWFAARLKCPYCGQEDLQRSGAWFTFRDGCTTCNYRFEREEGYFGGASQVINFSILSLSAFVIAGLLLWLFPALSALTVAAIGSGYIVIAGIAFFPIGMALWIYLDHCLHPLTADDFLLLPSQADKNSSPPEQKKQTAD